MGEERGGEAGRGRAGRGCILTIPRSILSSLNLPSLLPSLYPIYPFPFPTQPLPLLPHPFSSLLPPIIHFLQPLSLLLHPQQVPEKKKKICYLVLCGVSRFIPVPLAGKAGEEEERYLRPPREQAAVCALGQGV